MDVIGRRTLLVTGIVVGLAGCIGSGIDGTGNDGDGNGNGTDNDGDENSDSDDVKYGVFQLGPSLAQPLWAMVEDATGFHHPPQRRV